jgi:hypothetical protein
VFLFDPMSGQKQLKKTKKKEEFFTTFKASDKIQKAEFD